MRGQVIATFSRRMRVRLDSGETIEARIRGKRLRPVCGDFVALEPISGESDWLIVGLEDRRNALTRPNRRGDTEVLAANLDRLVVVAAGTPVADWFIVDRYLCAAELMSVDAMIVYNKADLLGADADRTEIDAIVADYRRIGYPVLFTSAESLQGIDELGRELESGTSILVGQSGVGKSSLVNRLLEDTVQKTAALSTKHREGRHTTVNSVMLTLRSGGRVIDSPGVRDYAPAIAAPGDVAEGFPEIKRLSHHCRFKDCRHLREPDCAVRAGVGEAVSERRYASYRRLLNLARKLS